jgi:hypothetical protein
MNDMLGGLSIVALYHCLLAVFGFCIVWMGYLLFKAGLFSPAGDLALTSGDKKLQLKRAAPGTFFVAFGAIVILVVTYKGVTADEKQGGSQNQAHTATVVATGASAVPQETAPPPASISISGMGGGGLHSVRTSDAIKESLSAYAICMKYRGRDDSGQKCQQQLEANLKTVPLSDELKRIEALDEIPKLSRTEAQQEELRSLRERLLPASYGKDAP